MPTCARDSVWPENLIKELSIKVGHLYWFWKVAKSFSFSSKMAVQFRCYAVNLIFAASIYLQLKSKCTFKVTTWILTNSKDPLWKIVMTELKQALEWVRGCSKSDAYVFCSIKEEIFYIIWKIRSLNRTLFKGQTRIQKIVSSPILPLCLQFI